MSEAQPPVSAGAVSFEVDPEGIEELGPALMFPLKVYNAAGGLVFQHPVMLRADFYRQLMTMPDGRQHLFRILKNRLREELARRAQHPAISIRERMEMLTLPTVLNG